MAKLHGTQVRHARAFIAASTTTFRPSPPITLLARARVVTRLSKVSSRFAISALPIRGKWAIKPQSKFYTGVGRVSAEKLTGLRTLVVLEAVLTSPPIPVMLTAPRATSQRTRRTAPRRLCPPIRTPGPTTPSTRSLAVTRPLARAASTELPLTQIFWPWTATRRSVKTGVGGSSLAFPIKRPRASKRDLKKQVETCTADRTYPLTFTRIGRPSTTATSGIAAV